MIVTSRTDRGPGGYREGVGMTGLQRARSAVFALLATVLALIAHVLGGGTAPGADGFAVVALAAATAGSWLAGRRPGGLRATAALGLVQVLAHAAFLTSSPGAAAGAGHEGHGSSMTLAHAVAVVVTGWLLTRGERSVEALLDRVLPSLPGRPRAASPTGGPRPAPALLAVTPLGRVAVAHLTFRGPPGSRAVTC